jgi:large subunit ribosomal protein L18
VAASTADPQFRQEVAYGGNCAAATALGALLAQRALEAGIKQAAFDRREYKYHGRVAALADAVRDAGVDLGAKKVVKEPTQKKKGGKKPKGEGKKPKAEGKKKAAK